MAPKLANNRPGAIVPLRLGPVLEAHGARAFRARRRRGAAAPIGALCADAGDEVVEATIEELQALIGKEAGVSSWVVVDQARIDAFAAATGDDQWIHVDVARAAATPFGGTIAHGLLTLSLVPIMAYEALPGPRDVRMALNYGYNKVRFTAPVRSGKRVRACFKLLAMREAAPGRWDRISEVTVEIEGEPRPALVAEMISVIYL